MNLLHGALTVISWIAAILPFWSTLSSLPLLASSARASAYTNDLQTVIMSAAHVHTCVVCVVFEKTCLRNTYMSSFCTLGKSFSSIHMFLRACICTICLYTYMHVSICGHLSICQGTVEPCALGDLYAFSILRWLVGTFAATERGAKDASSATSQCVYMYVHACINIHIAQTSKYTHDFKTYLAQFLLDCFDSLLDIVCSAVKHNKQQNI